MTKISQFALETLNLSVEEGRVVARLKKNLILDVQLAHQHIDIFSCISEVIGRSFPLCFLVSGVISVKSDARVQIRSRALEIDLVGLAYVNENKSQEIMVKYMETRLDLLHYEKSFHSSVSSAKSWLAEKCKEHGAALLTDNEASEIMKALTV